MVLSDKVNAGELLLQGSVATTAVVFLQKAVLDMIPYLIIAFFLILVDLYFGIKAARKRGELIRASGAFRRTMGKTMEYICWVILASSLSVAFDTRIIEWVVLGIVMGNEVLSILTNYFEVHGYKLKGLNIFKIVSDKTGVDLGDATLEKMDEEEKKGDKE